MKLYSLFLLIGCILTLIILQQTLYAQAQRPYDKAFFQAEINRYNAYLQRSPAGTASTTSLDVKYYRLDLVITTSPQYLKGSALMNAVSTRNGLDTISLDLMNNMTIDSVKVGGTAVSFTQFPSTFTVTLDRTYNQGELLTVEVFYRGRPGSSGFGSFTFASHLSTPWIWSLSEPYGAKDWWPCNDHPSDKADSADIFITCDLAFKVGSNGKLLSVNDNGDGTHTYHWHEGYPISTYLVSVAITNYAEFSDWFQYTPTDSMEILNYVLPESLSAAKPQLKLVVDELRIYSNLFGLYPFVNEKYGHSQFGWGGGMEHQTMTSLGGFSDGLTAHELAHQWFGDMITCRTWPDIWLNEGFATFCEHLYEREKYGEAFYWSGMNSNMADAKLSTASLYVSDSSNTSQLFDWNRVYAKGSVVLHMLRHVLGDSMFFRSMYNYANDSRYRFGTAATADFQAACESTSGKSLGYFFSEWIYGEKYPQYFYQWSAESSAHGAMVHLYVRQTTGTTNPRFFTMPIDVAVSAAGWDTTVVLFNDSLTQRFSFEVTHLPTSVVLDSGNWILKTAVGAPSAAGPAVVDSIVTRRLTAENVRMDIWLRNMRTDSAVRVVQGILETTDPVVKGFVLNNRNFGDIAPGARSIMTTFVFKIDTSIKVADIPFMLWMTSNGTTYWAEGIVAELRAPTGVITSNSEIPTEYRLVQNYPNPFNLSTTIKYQLPTQSHVTLKVFDVLGREVATLVNEVEQPGHKSVTFDASRLSSGIYYYRLVAKASSKEIPLGPSGQAGNYIETKKLLLIR